MPEIEPERMQRLPPDKDVFLVTLVLPRAALEWLTLLEAQHRPAAVQPVGDDGMAEVLHVDAQLVRAPSARLQPHVREAAEPLDDLVEGDRLARVAPRLAGHHLFAPLRMHAHVRLDEVAVELDRAPRDRAV